jgi:hypothetical protein
MTRPIVYSHARQAAFGGIMFNAACTAGANYMAARARGAHAETDRELDRMVLLMDHAK